MLWNILGWGVASKEELEGEKRGKTVNGMYCMREESIIDKIYKQSNSKGATNIDAINYALLL